MRGTTGSQIFIVIFICAASMYDINACTSMETQHILDPEVESKRLSPIEMEGFKFMFLSKLGITKPPTREELCNVSLPLTPRNRDNGHESESTGYIQRQTTVRKTISFVGKADQAEILPEKIHDDSKFIEITFDNLTALSTASNSRLLSAKLKFYFNFTDLTPPSRKVRSEVKIYQFVSEHGQRKVELVDRRSVSIGEPTWRTFDIIKAIQRWESQCNDTSDMKLLIHMDSQELCTSFWSSTLNKELNVEERISLHLYNHLSVNVTFLTEIKEKPLQRTRRTLPGYNSGTDCIRGETTCCREERVISFADLDWDYWIVSPDHFSMYHCRGSCPQGHRMANNYATIRSQLHAVNPSEWEAPCCTASSLGDLTVVHLTPKGYQEAVMEDIIAEECMCV